MVVKIIDLDHKGNGMARIDNKIVFIPKKNHKDIKDLPEEILDSLSVIEVNNYIEVYNHIFG